MSYNLLCKLFGHTFASQICGNYSITCSASYLVIHLLRKYMTVIVTVAVLLPVSGSPVSERKCLPD